MNYKSMKKPAFTLAFGCCQISLDDELVEAAGVGLCTGIDNTQVTDSEALTIRRKRGN
jgi:hypothetical protein